MQKAVHLVGVVVVDVVMPAELASRKLVQSLITEQLRHKYYRLVYWARLNGDC
jgi:hypothetical protein